MNYKVLALIFLISSSNVSMIKAGQQKEQTSYAHCLLTIEIPEAWHDIAVHPCPDSYSKSENPRDDKKCDDYAAILALKKPAQNEPCQVYLQYPKWRCQESYTLTSLEIDKEREIFSAIVKKTYYDHKTKKLIWNKNMFSISGTLNEPVTFHINNVGNWLFQLFRYKEVIPKRTINCTLIVR